MKLISGNLVVGTEFLDRDEADGKLPSCNKGSEAKKVFAPKQFAKGNTQFYPNQPWAKMGKKDLRSLPCFMSSLWP